jgi:hypothetical protein
MGATGSEGGLAAIQEERYAYWGRHIQLWQQSDQSKRAYCRANGLKPDQFYRWCRKLSATQPNPPRFIPVHLPTIAQTPYAIELTLANGRILRFDNGTDPAWLSRLVRELDPRC